MTHRFQLVSLTLLGMIFRILTTFDTYASILGEAGMVLQQCTWEARQKEIYCSNKIVIFTPQPLLLFMCACVCVLFSVWLIYHHVCRLQTDTTGQLSFPRVSLGNQLICSEQSVIFVSSIRYVNIFFCSLPALHQKFDLPAPFVLHTDCPHYWRFHLPGPYFSYMSFYPYLV